MSKLYTEEQVRKLLYQLSFIPSRIDDTIDSLTPIKLPSDEEIRLAGPNLRMMFFADGAKWMRDKIKGGNNE